MRHLFLANNTGFVLKHAASLLAGGEWAARRQGRVVQHMAGYVEASWAPVVACLCLDGTCAGKPTAKILAKFNSKLEEPRTLQGPGSRAPGGAAEGRVG